MEELYKRQNEEWFDHTDETETEIPEGWSPSRHDYEFWFLTQNVYNVDFCWVEVLNDLALQKIHEREKNYDERLKSETREMIGFRKCGRPDERVILLLIHG